MGWSGGSYTKGNSATGGWSGDASLGIGIEAGRHDTQDDDFATGIDNCIAKDGQNSATANLPMGGFKHTNVANASSNDEYTTQGQLKDNSFSADFEEVGVNTPTFSFAQTKLEVRPNTSGTDESVNVVVKSNIADAGAANFLASGTHNSAERIAQLGVTTHSGITNAVGYISMNEEDGNNSVLWTDNGGLLRIGTALSQAGTTGGTVVGTQTSDERLKDIDPDGMPYGLDAVKSLQPIKFKLHTDPDQNDKLGFGAQTTKAIVPEAVYDTKEVIEGENPSETKLAMDYATLIPVLVKAIQELEAKVASLEAQIA